MENNTIIVNDETAPTPVIAQMGAVVNATSGAGTPPKPEEPKEQPFKINIELPRHSNYKKVAQKLKKRMKLKAKNKIAKKSRKLNRAKK